MSVFNRMNKLEQALKDGAFKMPTDIRAWTDEQLMKVILDDAGLPAGPDDVTHHVRHFTATGELPEAPAHAA